MKIPFEWEPIAHLTDRARVIGGWVLLSSCEVNQSESMVFIPDPDHEWEIEKT